MGSSDSRRGRRRRTSGRIGLEEVAKLAGVSIASVSRVLNSTIHVGDATRQRVEKACAELGYVPNGAARALSSRRTRAVGAIVPSIENSGFASAVAALQQRLEQAGYTLLLANSGYDLEAELREATALLTHGVDGLVLVGDQHDPRLIPTLERNGVVFVETWTLSQERPCVGFDNMKAAGQIVDYLLDLGHTEIGVITGRPQNNDRAATRIAGIKANLAARGLKLGARLLVQHPYRILDGRLAMRALASSKSSITALICGNDQLAFGALIEAKSLGIDVPRDLSITGFNDLDYAAHLDPPLTTMRIPADEIGTKAANYILQRLQGEPIIPMSEIDIGLIVRGSTAAPARRSGLRTGARKSPGNGSRHALRPARTP